MGVFTELSSIPGVEKRVRFKQGILLSVAHQQGHISDKHFEVVKGGACAAYLMAWFAQQYQVATHFHRAKGIKSREDEASISTAAMFAPHQVFYETAGNGSWSALAERFEFTIKSDGVDQRMRLESVVPRLYKSLDSVVWRAGLIDLDVKDSRYGHCLGLFKEPGAMRFFDANVGEYLVPEEQISRGYFVGKYDEIVRRELRFEYTGALGYRVRKPNVFDTDPTADAILDWAFD